MGKIRITFVLFCLFFGLALHAGTNDSILASVRNVKVNVDFNNTGIDDVMRIFSDKMKINIIRNNNVKAQITASLKDMAVIDAFEFICRTHGLNYLLETGMTGEKVIRIFNQQDFETQALTHQGQAKVIRLRYNKAEDVYKKLTEALGGKSKQDGGYGTGVIYADEKNNSIIVIDREDRLKDSNIENIISAFDQPVPQVLIEAKILSVSLNKGSRYGINWGLVLGGGFNMPFSGDTSTDPNIKYTWTFTTKDGTKGSLTGLLTALSEQGNVKILSNPRITALNNEAAKIIVGKNEPYTVTTTIASSGSPVVTADTKFVEVGIGITVTPQINKDYITLKIKPNVSSAAERSSTSIPPTVTKSEAETTVMIRDKSTLVIGGLIETKETSTINRVPVLGYIPLLGYLFSSRSYTTTRSELVIFLTPTVISYDVEK
ncbi:MAG: secretin N-terminal domain-containing protein [bacterium]|nr:secretin N-terminal domain-containing protein [bacterium]